MKPGDIAHAWVHPSHVGGKFPKPRRAILLSVSDWYGKRLWRVRFLDEKNAGELDYNEDCLQVVEEWKQ
jgi:hypothetical protein